METFKNMYRIYRCYINNGDDPTRVLREMTYYAQMRHSTNFINQLVEYFGLGSFIEF